MAGRLLGNRRQYKRLRQKYDTLVRDSMGDIVFRGKTIDISRGGAQIAGLPVLLGVEAGQKVRVEFLVMPKDLQKTSKRFGAAAIIWRVDEKEDSFTIAVKFEQELPG